MSDQKKLRRRRFLQATGASALTVGFAGCTGGGDGNGTVTNSASNTAYPYGANELLINEAKSVMKDAGYGPDNRYELDWLQYVSPAWKEMAKTIRGRLDSAYIDMNIADANFGELLNTTEKGDHEAFTLGWVADYPGARNFLQLVDPENTVYDAEGSTPNGARLFWSKDAKGDPKVRQNMTAQFDRIQNNPENTEEAQSIRAEATARMEELLWESAALLPVYHTVDDVYWYDRVDYDPPGGMGPSRAKTSTTVGGLEGSDTLHGTSGTFNSLDPIASGNTESGANVMNMFDAPMNYVNGTTEVEPLIVKDYSVSDDLTKYEFTLKEGIQFHDDYGEVTADDVVYSIRRLVESTNSSNTYFPISVLDIDREENDDGTVVAGSTAVEATGDYTFTITLRNAFGYTLEVLAYSAFSVVPEGIVGDIEGYDGDMDWQEFSTNPVGCGPFVFEQWQSGVGGEFRASAFPDYHGGEPAVGEIQNTILSEPDSIYNRFINGNADVSAIPTTQYDSGKVNFTDTEGAQQLGEYGPIGNDTTVNMSRTPSINTYYIGFNMEVVPKAIRQAMAYVLTRGDFVNAGDGSVFKGRGEPAYHLTPPQVYPGGPSGYEKHWKEQ